VEPYVSIVIPVYNEEGILRPAIDQLRRDLARFPWSYEILIAENGSTDQTVTIAQHLQAELDDVFTFSVGEPNYGKALREGILRARGTYVICDEIDLCDTAFYARALELLEFVDAEMVVGSKAMKGAQDSRPAFRRFATRVINGMLRVAVGFEGTDTHGLKAFRRETVLPVVRCCVIDKDLFASELVIRTARAGRAVVEIPVTVAEKRRPAINLVRRVPTVLRHLAHLTFAIRFDRGGPMGPMPPTEGDED
jgi:glycosyltransferase involved in cell wall biosynthesis